MLAGDLDRYYNKQSSGSGAKRFSTSGTVVVVVEFLRSNRETKRMARKAKEQ